MRINFSAQDIRDVMNVCGSNVVTSNKSIGYNVENSPGLRYIQFMCKWNECIVTGGNGFAVGLMRIPCTADQVAEEIVFYLKPFKVAKWATQVAVDVEPSKTDPGVDVVKIEMRMNAHENAEVITQENERIFPTHYELIEKNVIDDSPAGKYVILDRRLLIQCLEGLKGCDSVIFNLGSSAIRPLMLRPYDDDYANGAEVIICPVRPINGGTELVRP